MRDVGIQGDDIDGDCRILGGKRVGKERRIVICIYINLPNYVKNGASVRKNVFLFRNMALHLLPLED